jgi:hypothetical protein
MTTGVSTSLGGDLRLFDTALSACIAWPLILPSYLWKTVCLSSIHIPLRIFCGFDECTVRITKLLESSSGLSDLTVVRQITRIAKIGVLEMQMGGVLRITVI